MAAPATEQNTLPSDAAALRDAYILALGIAPDQRRRALRTVLQYRLRNLAPAAACNALLRMRAAFAGETVSPAAETPAAAASGVAADALAQLLRLITGADAVGDAGDVVREVTARLQTEMQVLRAVLRKPHFSLEELLRRAARDLSAHDGALEHAARESFDRVLGALDPAEIMKSVPKKTLSTDSMYKAALFDAIKEKHEHLQMYHGKGRLVRDYKSAYKKYVQEETSR
jgi:hypothetical protein